jgi:hydroxypyruvate isomerase
MSRRGASRREWLFGTAAALVGAAPVPALRSDAHVPSGRLKQSVSRWPFASVPLDRFCREAAAMGIRAVDLLRPKDWDWDV